jgi:hypothetical protein
VGYELDYNGLDAVAAWHAARPACIELGLWPMACDHSGPDVYSRWAYTQDEDRAQWPRPIIARAEQVTWPDPPRDATEYFARDWVDVIRMCAQGTVRRVGEAPTEQELLTACPDPDYKALERHLLRWEQARRPTVGQEPPGRFDDPLLDLGTNLVLIPDPDPWVVPAYIHYWGAGSRNEHLVRALRSWYERYGAMPYASTGVTLHLVVERPVTDIFDALDVAAQQMPFCKMDDSLRERARALFGAAFWELYDRP